MQSFTCTIIEAVITKHGTTIVLNRNWRKLWVVVPGATIRPSQRSFRKLYFPGQYNVDKIVTDLKALPLLNPKRLSLDFDQEYPITTTVAYRKKSYVTGSNQIRKQPHNVALKEELQTSVTFTSDASR